MDAPADRPWFLRKHEDGTIFGPVSFGQLAGWATQAQVAPQDTISSDGVNWIKAPMQPELGMDWIVEVTSERLYGPTTLGAIHEFLELGEISQESTVINACDASRQQICDIMPLLTAHASTGPARTAASDVEAPAAAGMAIAPSDRIRELEDALREERRAAADAEARYRDLEQRYLELVGSRSTL
ncbi:hypothetical protein BH20VER2_BH20VER2_02420 [soil metagenome]